MASDDQPNPMEEFLRQFGITPGPDGRFDLNQLMGPLQQAMQQFASQMSSMGTGTGEGLNWSLVKDIARKVTASAGPDPTPSASEAVSLRDTVGLADLWLDEHTAFARTQATSLTWSRAEWVEGTISTWEQLVGSISASLAAAVGGLMQREDGDTAAAGMTAMMEPMMRMAATGMLSAQVGQGIGQLATDVLTATDLGIPLTARPVVALLPTNIAAFADGLDVPRSDVNLYLALRESARQRLFAHVAWLAPQMLALIEHYARGIVIDASAFEEAMESQLSSGLTPEGLEEFGQQMAGRLFQPALSPEQIDILARLETLVATVEGWVDDVVTQATAGLMPRADALLEMVRRRRAAGGASEAALKTLLNLELRPRRVRDAANLWAAVRSARGIQARDAVWSHPDLIPTSNDLDDPLGFAEHGHSSDEQSDDLDAQLARLLDEERGGTGDAS